MSHSAQLVSLARGLGIRIAVAESLTGGLVAAEIVSIPGASAVFTGGIVAYDTALKQTLLGVDEGLLMRHGPVHAEVAKQMARGVRNTCAVAISSDAQPVPAGLGLATTGVAGPDPDPQTGQPAGTVWIAVSSASGERAVLLTDLEAADRHTIRASAVAAVIDLAVETLQEQGEPH